MSTPISSETIPTPGGEHREVLAARAVARRYGGTQALRGVDVSLAAGRVHALLGENGAGKSTLVRILAGAERPDEGTLVLGGHSVQFSSTAEALAAGIAPVYQEPQDFPSLSVLENLFLGQEETTTGGMLRLRAQEARAVELLTRVGLGPETTSMLVRDLSIAERQLVQIARSLVRNPQVLLLDEPSTVLTATEIDRLFEVVRRTTATGTAVVLISHRLDEVFAIADDITVLRDGALSASRPAQDWTRAQVIRSMTGHDVEVTSKTESVNDEADTPFRVEGLSMTRAFADVDLRIVPGEVHCVLGLVGSGASEIAACVAGAATPTTGSVMADGERVTSLRSARRLGIRYLPKDRKRDALFAPFSIAVNAASGNYEQLAPLGVLRSARERTTMEHWMRALRIKAPRSSTPIGALSGGNQQKVLLARVFIAEPRVLVLDEPTRGVDIGAREEIHALIEERASQGDAVLVVSSDIEEVRRVADRITVMCKGRIAGRFGAGAPVAELLAAAVGAEEAA